MEKHVVKTKVQSFRSKVTKVSDRDLIPGIFCWYYAA